MNANEFRRWLRRQGCTFETHKGGSGHLTARRDLGTGLVRKIKKDLGLE